MLFKCDGSPDRGRNLEKIAVLDNHLQKTYLLVQYSFGWKRNVE